MSLELNNSGQKRALVNKLQVYVDNDFGHGEQVVKGYFFDDLKTHVVPFDKFGRWLIPPVRIAK